MNVSALSLPLNFEPSSPFTRALCSIIKLQSPIPLSVACCIHIRSHSGVFHLCSKSETLAFITLVSGYESPEINISTKSFSSRITPAHPDYDLILSHLRLILEKISTQSNNSFSFGLN